MITCHRVWTRITHRAPPAHHAHPIRHARHVRHAHWIVSIACKTTAAAIVALGISAAAPIHADAPAPPPIFDWPAGYVPTAPGFDWPGIASAPGGAGSLGYGAPGYPPTWVWTPTGCGAPSNPVGPCPHHRHRHHHRHDAGVPPTDVPEPGTLAVILVGLLGLAGVKFRRRA